MANLDTATLNAGLTKVVPAIFTREAGLTALGATDWAGKADTMKWVEVASGPDALVEGGTKQSVDLVVPDAAKRRFKLASVFTVTQEFYHDSDNDAVIADILSQIEGAWPKGAVAAIFHNTNPRDGSTLIAGGIQTIAANAPSVPFTYLAEGAPVENNTFDRTLRQTVDYDKATPTGVALSEYGFNLLNWKENQYGDQKYSDLSKFMNLPTLVNKGVRHPAWGSGYTGEPSDVLAVVGDFRNLSLKVSDVATSISTEATVGGENMFTENKVAILVEQWFEYAIRDLNAFTVVQGAVAAP